MLGRAARVLARKARQLTVQLGEVFLGARNVYATGGIGEAGRVGSAKVLALGFIVGGTGIGGGGIASVESGGVGRRQAGSCGGRLSRFFGGMLSWIAGVSPKLLRLSARHGEDENVLCVKCRINW